MSAIAAYVLALKICHGPENAECTFRVESAVIHTRLIDCKMELTSVARTTYGPKSDKSRFAKDLVCVELER